MSTVAGAQIPGPPRLGLTFLAFSLVLHAHPQIASHPGFKGLSGKNQGTGGQEPTRDPPNTQDTKKAQ
ncbi:hypothetical protein H8959_014368 [Pygathrix nigripes]